METATTETSSSKKDPFEQLSKEELIKKCKQFLTIAQKAKQNKDELTEENKIISNKLKEYEIKTQNDLKSMQELINVLTLQKLDLVNSNDVLTKQNTEYKNKYIHCQEELTESNIRVQNQDTENQSCNRQIKRLTEENDQLIFHLDGLEKRIIELNKIGEQQRVQLLALEKQNVVRNENLDNTIEKHPTTDENTNISNECIINKDFEMLQVKCNKLEVEVNNTKMILEEKNKTLENVNEEIDTLKMENAQLNELKKYCQLKTQEIEILQEKIKSLNIIIDELNLEIKSKTSSVNTLTSDVDNVTKELKATKIILVDTQNKYETLSGELENTKKAKEHYNEKLKSYHSKLIKVYNDLKDLKLTKNKLLDIINNYSEYINKWQSDIKRVSNKFKKELEQRDSEINLFKSENTKLISNIEFIEKELSQLKLDQEKSSASKLNLNDEIKFKDEKIAALLDENKNLLKSVEANILENADLSNNLKVNADKLDCCMKENITLVGTIEELKRSSLENTNETILKNEIQTQRDKINYLLKENELILNNIFDVEENIKLFENKFIQMHNLFEKKICEHIERISSHEKSLIILQNKIKTLTDNINTKDTELNALKSSLKSFEHLEKENRNLSTELEIIKDNVIKLTTENNDFALLLQQVELKNSEYLKTIDNLKNDFENNFISKEKFNDLSNIKIELTEKLDVLNETTQKNENELSSYERDCSDLRNQVSISKRENADLLREMNDMNQALKERGETISKQQEYVQELIRKMQSLELDAKSCKEEKVKFEEEITLLKNQTSTHVINTVVKEHDSLISDKNEIIKSLQEEIKQLKESFNSSLVRDNQDGGDYETMSTSTISRTEDANRLRDLEGSWEERYTKLRTLALKLKGKVKELTEHLSVERTEKNEIQNKLTSITRNLQTIQSEYDKIQDKFETVEKENKQKMKQIETLTDENNNIKQELNDSNNKISKFEFELDSLRKEKLGSNSATKHYTSQIQNLKKEVEDGSHKIKDLGSKISKLESNILAKEQEVQNEIKSHNVTKEKLQKIEKENKKNSVLSLEMEDYERSLKDLSQKLEKKNELISKLEENTNTQDTAITSLNNQLKLLEETISEKEAYCLDVEKKLRESQTRISSAEAATAQRENRIREVMKSLEEYKSKSEEENTELAQTISKNQIDIDLLKSERDHSKSVVLGLEEKIKELTKNSNGFEAELHHLKNEYSNYKVRAQSVLRQNQTRDIALEERLIEEVSELKSKVEVLNAELETTANKLKIMHEEYDLVSQEKTKAVFKSDELQKLIMKEKEDNESLLARQQQLISEHRESMRAQKIHTDTLTQCYKQQLAEQEERHVKELTDLKALHIHSTLHVSKSQEEHIDVTSMPREDGEGSESIGSNNYPSKTSVLSLDKLLNPDNDSNFDYETELTHFKKRISEYEAKVSHLTDLLADTEQDLAKHAQLNQHLKEEIRRHQRSVEREKHAENLEYLKNVVFKFLTLHSGDEKSHLVPVLNTILKLSPDETQKLNAVAKGTDLNRSWGSYLPIWSGSSNQN